MRSSPCRLPANAAGSVGSGPDVYPWFGKSASIKLRSEMSTATFHGYADPGFHGMQPHAMLRQQANSHFMGRIMCEDFCTPGCEHPHDSQNLLSVIKHVLASRANNCEPCCQAL